MTLNGFAARLTLWGILAGISTTEPSASSLRPTKFVLPGSAEKTGSKFASSEERWLEKEYHRYASRLMDVAVG